MYVILFRVILCSYKWTLGYRLLDALDLVLVISSILFLVVMLSYPLAHACDLGVLRDCEYLSVDFEDLLLHRAQIKESGFV